MAGVYIAMIRVHVFVHNDYALTLAAHIGYKRAHDGGETASEQDSSPDFSVSACMHACLYPSSFKACLENIIKNGLGQAHGDFVCI